MEMSFIPVIKDEFSALLLQSSVSHDPSEIILIYFNSAQETCLNYYYRQYLKQLSAFLSGLFNE